MRAAARIAKAPPTTAINVTTLPADGDEPPDTAATGASVDGAVVPSIARSDASEGDADSISPADVGDAVGAEDPKSTPRFPAVGAEDDADEVGAIENPNPRLPAVGAMDAPRIGATVGALV